MDLISKVITACTVWMGIAVAAPAIWDGSADVSWYESSAQAYNLRTAEQLAGLAKLVNNGNTFEGKTITLGADIFLNDTAGAVGGTWASIARTPWTPIGTASRPFKGEFDGIAGKKNRKIYGLYFNDTTKSNVGLFGYTDGVKISNLDLPVGRVTAANNTGALIGYAVSGSITNVHSEVKVTGKNKVGGLVGYSTGSLTQVSVKENIVGQDSVGGLAGYTSGTIAGTTKDSSFFIGNVSGRKYVGGAVGYGSAISKTYVEGTMKGDSSYVGGLAGYATGTITTSYHEGGDVNGAGYVGGLAGYTTGAVTSSHSEGNVSGKGYVGGLVGYATGSVTGSHSEGDVTGTADYVGGLVGYGASIGTSYHEKGNVSGKGYVGGLVGYATGSVTGSHSEGDVTGTGDYVGGLIGLSYYYYSGSATLTFVVADKSYSIGNVKGEKYVGGLIGLDSIYRYSYNTYSLNRQIKRSYAQGSVEGAQYIGGVLGKSNYGYRSSSYSSNFYSTIDSVSHTSGIVSGSSYVGGLVGYTYGAVTGSHSEGDVTGSADYVGGLVGYGSSIESSYHKKGIVSGQSYVGGLAGYATSSSITGSHSEGDVTGTGDYVGGLIGLSFYYYSGSATLTMVVADSSYSIGHVKGAKYVGGLIGLDSIYRYSNNTYSLNRQIKRSYAQGSVEGTQYIGGVLGKSNYGYRSSSYSLNFYSTIDSVSHTSGIVSGSSYVGGLVGCTYGSVMGSHSEGNVTGSADYVGGLVGSGTSIGTSYHENGKVSGLGYVGGLAGYTTGAVTSSHSEGDVTGTTDYVGGLVGYGAATIGSSNHDRGNVSGRGFVGGLVGYATGSVTGSHSEGYVTGTSGYVGGLVGRGAAIDSSYHEGGDVSGADYVGGLAGYTTGTVTGSHSEGDVTGTASYVGGLVGYASGSVIGSHSEGDVTGTGNYVGGLIGQSYYYYSGSATLTMVVADSSYSIGHVKGAKYVGGLIGLDSIYRYSNNTYSLNRQIKRSYAQGAVEGAQYIGGVLGKSNYGYRSSSYSSNFYSTIDSVSHTSGIVNGESYVGGLVGYTYGSVTGSHSEGDVTGTGNYVGGLTGFGSVDSSYHIGGDVSGSLSYVGGLTGNGSVSNSYSEGNITGLDYVGGAAGLSSKIRNSYAKAAFVRGRNLIGGLAGSVSDSIEGSYFEGDSVTGIYQVGGLVGYAKSAVDSSYSTANVKGDDNVGGLIGSAYGNVSNSYALGNVIGDVDNSSEGNDNLGGLVGYQYSGSVSKSMALGNVSGTTKLGGLVGRFDGTTISQSYANGNVTGSYYGDPADEVGNWYIGGLVGYAKGALEETYASGVVKGIEDEPVYTGCVVGYVNGSLSVTKSYYDKTKCGLGIDGGKNAASVSGTPDKTTAEMQTQSTFEDWDFTDTWKIMENTYPFLQIYSNSLTNAVVTTQSFEGINYDGTAKTPLVTSVTLFGETLEYETEYTIAYANNVNAGTASINVCGVMPYGGCKVVNFEIAGIAVEPTIAEIDNMTYTGRALTPEIEVYNGETLLAATDYSVEYKDNINAGTATVTVTMKGNYSGSASMTFVIEKATPVISRNPTAGDVVLGQTLASSELTGGQANVDGEFVWKTPSTKPTLENEGYAVVFVPADTNYTKSAEIIVPVKVLDVVYVAVHAGAVTLDSVVLVKGAEYTLPEAPEKTGYDFKGLYIGKSEVGKAGDKIAVTENTIIDAVYQVKTFMVTFSNGSVELQTVEVAYGEMPKYSGVVPTKTATAQYAYLFKEWSPELTVVTGAASYTAVFDSVVNRYVITFANGAESLQSDSVSYGDLPEYKGPVAPTKSSTEKYDYVFNGWSPAITSVTGSATYAAVFDSTLRKYTITFKNGTTTLQASDVVYGSKPSYTGTTPAKTSTEIYDYVFNGWSPAITSVTGAATYTAVFDSTFHKYAITFKNGTTTLQTIDVAYGSTPSYTGTVPKKSSTDKYSYIFKDWNPELTKVTGTASYTAVFDSTLREYSVTFKNGTTTLQTLDVAYGEEPSYTGSTPTKTSTDKYSYTFKGWNPTIVSVTGSATYTAVFDSTLREYSVTFKNGETTLQTGYVAYGTKPIYAGATPTKVSTEKCDYTFKSWSPTLASVTGVTTYTAVFDSTLRKYTVTFKNGSTTLQTNSVSYGTKPSFSGETPTKNATDKYTYTFKGWSPTLASVTGATTYTAVFDSSLRKYAITFKNGTVVLQMKAVAYGDKPSYTGSTPTKKATNKYIYEFKGWEPSIVAVTGAATYSAVFDSTRNTGIAEVGSIRSGLIVSTIGRTIQISAASKNSTYTVLDMQGRVLLRGRAESSNFNIAVPRAGCYLVRVGNATRKVQVK